MRHRTHSTSRSASGSHTADRPPLLSVDRVRLAHASAAIVVASLLAGCALTMERPVEPFDSELIEVAPNAFYESCVNLEKGDRLLYSYVSDPPMTLSIRRQIGDAVVSYIVRDRAREDNGLFLVPETEEYCLRWAPQVAAEVTWPTLLKYRIRLNTVTSSTQSPDPFPFPAPPKAP